jgi:hypothetical protein
MSSIIYPFDTPSNYTYDNTKIDVSGSTAKLKRSIANIDYTQDFTSDVGFTYDITKAEFVGGILRKKDWRPVGYSFIAALHTIIDGNWGGGVLTGTAVGGASIISGWLDCTGSTDKYVRYAALGNISAATQTGTYKTMYRPGTGTTQSEIFSIAKASGAKNLIALTRLASGTFKIQIYSNTITSIVNYTTPVYSTTPGTAYELEFFWDLDAGYTGLRINGTLLGIIQTGTGTRDTDVDYLRIGGYYIVAACNASFKDVECWPTVQHHADYSPGYLVYETIYNASNFTIPEMASLTGGFLALQNFTSSVVGAPLFTVQVGRSGNYLYWDGAGWTTSDRTYAKANSIATIVAHMGTLLVTGQMYIQFEGYFDDGNTLASIDTMTATMNQEYLYPITNPTITPNSTFYSTELLNFIAATSIVGSDNIKFIITENGSNFYWNGAAVVASNGTYSQSNTAAEILAHITAFVTARKLVGVIIFISSYDGTTTPLIDTLTITYNSALVPPIVPTLVNMEGFIYNANGPIANQLIKCRPYQAGYWNQNIFHEYAWEDLGNTDTDGFFSVEIYMNGVGHFWEIMIGSQSYKVGLVDTPELDAKDCPTWVAI